MKTAIDQEPHLNAFLKVPKGTEVTFNFPNLNMIDYKDKSMKDAYQRKMNDMARANLLAKALTEKVGIVHIFNECHPKGGLTVAFRKISPYKSGKMVRVAVATCSKEDSFSRKIGANQALEMFFDDQTIDLPILQNFAEEDLNYAVKQAFTKLYNYI